MQLQRRVAAPSNLHARRNVAQQDNSSREPK
jgi:hypothetical protein